jgi:lysophospholipase L1-like esterase
MSLQYLRSPLVRLALVATTLVVLLTGALFERPAIAQFSLPPGLQTNTIDYSGVTAIELVSPERFALVFDHSGIVAWYDLGTDPERRQNLVPSDMRLIDLRDQNAELLVGSIQVVAESPVRTEIVLTGSAGDGPATARYTVWVGGQVELELEAEQPLATSLQFSADALNGAALADLGVVEDAPAWSYRGLLYLSAWSTDLHSDGTSAAVVSDNVGSSLATLQGEAATVMLTPPAEVVRQPRFRLSGWPGADVLVQLNGAVLVEGVDYLKAYDPKREQLDLQYLGLLPQGDAASRTFTLSAQPASTSIGLELLNASGSAARTLDPAGRLVVDANMPSGTRNKDTTQDVFAIPYIQTWPTLQVRATVQNPPAGFSGVRFRISAQSYVAEQDGTFDGQRYVTSFNLPGRAEYTLTATVLVNGQPAAFSETIDPVAYGRVFVSIGDSITAGKLGDYIAPGDPGYPMTVPPAPGSAPVSADGRNYYQSDNTLDDLGDSQQPTYENTYYAGYQVPLNDLLAASTCLNAPVFILNDGFSGIRTARDFYNPNTLDPGEPGYVPPSPGDKIGPDGEKNALGKADAYRSHIAALGADAVLLQVGTNDASATNPTSPFNEPFPAGVYRSDLETLISALRNDDANLPIWLARLPWRTDGSGTDQIQARQTRIQDFNAEIVDLVEQLDNTTPTYLGPDFYSYFVANQGQISGDELHPTSAGFDGMAGLWAGGDPGSVTDRSTGLCAFYGAEPPLPTTTPSPTPTTPTATPGLSPDRRIFLPLLER